MRKPRPLNLRRDFRRKGHARQIRYDPVQLKCFERYCGSDTCGTFQSKAIDSEMHGDQT
jgi:hypothetical protein